MIHNSLIEYKNIRLRQVQIEDLDKLRKWRNDSCNTKYLSRIPYITREMQLKWYEDYLNNNDEMMFAIDETKDLQRIVGSVSLYNFTDKQAEFGKILIGDSAAHHRKIGLNALISLKCFAKEKLSLKKLYLHVYKENEAALRIYHSAGFSVSNEYTINGKIEYVMENVLDVEDSLNLDEMVKINEK